MRDDYLFTDEMKHDFICHHTADAPRFIDEGTILSDVYGKYSNEKEAAFRYCMMLFNKYLKYGAYDFAIRGYLFDKLKDNDSVIWFTKTDFEAECKYPDRVTCNA